MGQPSPIRPVVIARVHEVALKGRNRRHFMRVLTGNLAHALRGARYRALKIRSGRILIELHDLADWPTVRERVAQVFGIENFSVTLQTGRELAAIEQGLAALIGVEGPPAGSFRVRVKRSDKSYPLTSPEIEREIGGFIQDLTGAPVRLRDPDRSYQIELLHEDAYVNSAVLRGPGGLPVGASGRVVALISGGYDSPVAAYRMLKRGCELTLVHCHAYPFVRSTSIEKVIELAQHLGQHQPGLKLIFVPIGELQRVIALTAPPELRVVLYRRLMLRVAEAIACEERAGAVITGESLGQVASQTLPNIQAIEAAVDLTVLRPLIGLDKEEILAQARALGTEAISRTPDDDCCTVFVPRHPATHATPAQATRAEAGFDPQELVRLALERRVTLDGDLRDWNVAQVLSGPTAALGVA
ncbi:MAG TPA: tRNA uracil 4-sulfurtransferase ThiI [Thermomicrobiaceae bacterium]|nr:tRNA uracil 4-sulfurtransferase ThiI [Thermomicrobiaceae bacterium]